MSVYVDPLFDAHLRNDEGYQWCHMRADSLDELHAFAVAIGRTGCWFNKGNHYYDLTPSFREKAVAAGAIEISREEMFTMCMVRRKKRL